MDHSNTKIILICNIFILKIRAERFRADDLLQDAREDCYLSTLQIHHTSVHDARPYYLVVENERGTDRHAIQLNVEGTFTGAEQLFSLFYLINNMVMVIINRTFSTKLSSFHL